jgi:hypothetical protein
MLPFSPLLPYAFDYATPPTFIFDAAAFHIDDAAAAIIAIIFFDISLAFHYAIFAFR